MRAALGLLAALACLAFVLFIAPSYAVDVVAVDAGFGATSDPELVLGPPIGGGFVQGSTDTYSLGTGGSITVRMDPPVIEGPGADLMVCENPFYVTGTLQSYAEVAFVEVSTDGVNFARLENNYNGPNQPWPPFSGIVPARYRGFAGVMPVLAHPPQVDPLDVTASGADIFDLSELWDHPLVVAEQLDLMLIRYVRLVDVEGGIEADSSGHFIWDASIGGPGGGDSSDIDAVVGLNTLDNLLGGRPRVEVDIVNGFLVIVLEDLNGLSDIKPGITVTVNGFPVPFGLLLPFFQFTSLSPTRVEMTSLGPLPPGQFMAVFRVGLRDFLGLHGGDGVTIQ